MQQEHNKNLEHRLSYNAGVIQTQRHQKNPRLGQANTDAKCDKRIDTKTLEEEITYLSQRVPKTSPPHPSRVRLSIGCLVRHLEEPVGAQQFPHQY